MSRTPATRTHAHLVTGGGYLSTSGGGIISSRKISARERYLLSVAVFTRISYIFSLQITMCSIQNSLHIFLTFPKILRTKTISIFSTFSKILRKTGKSCFRGVFFYLIFRKNQPPNYLAPSKLISPLTGIPPGRYPLLITYRKACALTSLLPSNKLRNIGMLP